MPFYEVTWRIAGTARVIIEAPSIDAAYQQAKDVESGEEENEPRLSWKYMDVLCVERIAKR